MPGTDVVVVGGGIVGAATAYHLAGAGVSTTLVDRADAGHATRAGAGIVCPVTATVGHDELVDLAFAGADAYPGLAAQLADEIGGDPGFALTGMLSVSVGDRGQETVAATEAWAQHVAAGTAWGRLTGYEPLDPAAARLRCPALTPELSAALLLGSGGRVDGDRFRTALLEAARRRGVEVLHGAVERIDGGTDGCVVQVDSTALPCGYVVVCAGAWTNELLPGLDVVRPLRGEILHAVDPSLDTSDWPLVEIEGQGPYLIPWPRGRLGVGATVSAGAIGDTRPTVSGLRWCMDALDRATGGRADRFVVAECRVGFRPASRDGLPLIGPLPDRPHVLLATGHGADGLSWGPFTGRIIRDLVVGDPPPIGLAAFDPARFSAAGGPSSPDPGPGGTDMNDDVVYAHARQLPT